MAFTFLAIRKCRCLNEIGSEIRNQSELWLFTVAETSSDGGSSFFFSSVWAHLCFFLDTFLSLYMTSMPDWDVKFNFSSGKWHCWQLFGAWPACFFSWLLYNLQIQLCFVKLCLTRVSNLYSDSLSKLGCYIICRHIVLTGAKLEASN